MPAGPAAPVRAEFAPCGKSYKNGHGAAQSAADTALRLQRWLGSEAQGWLNLQSAYDLRTAEIAAGNTIAAEITPLAWAA